MNACLDVFCVLVERREIPTSQTEQMIKQEPAFSAMVAHMCEAKKDGVAADTLSANEFRRLLGAVEGRHNCHWIYDRLCLLLENFLAAGNSALPRSTKVLRCSNELVLLTIQLITFSPVFVLSLAQNRNLRHPQFLRRNSAGCWCQCWRC